MNNTDEIKTVIMLTGAKRIPHLEAEIFVNKELATLYLNNLCKEHDSPLSNACLAYWYATNVIDGRWLEAEVVIKTDEDYWLWYCTELYLTAID